MSKKQKYFIGLIAVVVGFAIVFMIGQHNKQELQNKNMANAEKALNMAIDYENKQIFPNGFDGALLLPRSKDNVDAKVYTTSSDKEEQSVFLVNVSHPSDSSGNGINKRDDSGQLVSLDNLKYDKIDQYILVDTKNTQNIEHMSDENIDAIKHEKLLEINNYKVQQNPKATLKSVNTYY